MIEVLVQIEFEVPDLSDGELVELTAAERRRSHELQRDGTLVRLWRDGTRQGSWGLWKVPSLDALDATLSTLPFWPWMSATLHPLERHRFALDDL